MGEILRDLKKRVISVAARGIWALLTSKHAGAVRRMVLDAAAEQSKNKLQSMLPSWFPGSAKKNNKP